MGQQYEDTAGFAGGSASLATPPTPKNPVIRQLFSDPDPHRNPSLHPGILPDLSQKITNNATPAQEGARGLNKEEGTIVTGQNGVQPAAQPTASENVNRSQPNAYQNQGDNCSTGAPYLTAPPVSQIPAIVFNTLQAQGETIRQIQESLRTMTLAMNEGFRASATPSPCGNVPVQHVPRNNAPSGVGQGYNRNSHQAPSGSHRDYSHEDGYRSRSPMSRWNLKFDGTKATMPVEDLVFRLNRRQALDQVSDQYMVHNFDRIVTGKADQWYWDFIKTYPHASWAMVKEALIVQFRGLTDDSELLVEMSNRKQGHREPFDDFLSAVLLLNNRRARRLPDLELIRILRRNLTTRLATMVYMVNFNSIIDFRQGCMDAERFINSRPQQFSDSRSIHEVKTEAKTDEQEAVEAYQMPKAGHSQQTINKSKWVCWNCGQQGHGYIDCPVPPTGVFCYKCGLRGAITPTCTRCAPGNASSLVRTPGDRRQPSFPGPNHSQWNFPFPPPTQK